MVCRNCQRKFRDPINGTCPFCGEANPPVTSGVMKTSTILISVGRTDAVYRSVEDVPQPLRKRLIRSTSGMNARTILIADPKGKEELAKAIRRLPGNAQQKLLGALFGEGSDAALSRFFKPSLRKVIPIVAAAALAGASIWVAVLLHHW